MGSRALPGEVHWRLAGAAVALELLLTARFSHSPARLRRSRQRARRGVHVGGAFCLIVARGHQPAPAADAPPGASRRR
eukprot:6407888-Lingulodinium_polyedra.AAC.1